MPFNPGKLVQEHDATQDLTLEQGDVVTIFSQVDISVPQEQRTKFVRLEGEFAGAGIYSVGPGETLRQLVARAGGLTPNAYLFGSEFTRESTRVFQQQRLNDYLSNLELEIDRSTINAASSSVTPQDTAATAAEVSASRSLVTKFRTLRATGRIVLTLDPNANWYRPSAPTFPWKMATASSFRRNPVPLTSSARCTTRTHFSLISVSNWVHTCVPPGAPRAMLIRSTRSSSARMVPWSAASRAVGSSATPLCRPG